MTLVDKRLRLGPQDALIVVDVQNDFCSGGALPVPNGEDVVPLLNTIAQAARDAGAVVVFSRDWHPPDHVSFHERGGPWPAHCVQHTRGAQFHPLSRLPSGSMIVSKGQHPSANAYSAFDGTNLARELHARGVRRVFVGGLAEEYCVKATVLDALAHGFETMLLCAATRPVEIESGDGARARDQMRRAGAYLLEEWPRSAAPVS